MAARLTSGTVAVSLGMAAVPFGCAGFTYHVHGADQWGVRAGFLWAARTVLTHHFLDEWFWSVGSNVVAINLCVYRLFEFRGLMLYLVEN